MGGRESGREEPDSDPEQEGSGRQHSIAAPKSAAHAPHDASDVELAPPAGDEPSSARDPGLPLPWVYPQAALGVAALRALMTTQNKRALFRRVREGREPDSDAPYRATVFWQSRPGSDTIVPFLRCRLGGTEQACDSALSFRRGECFAGQAWADLAHAEAEIGGFDCVDNLSNLADCGGDLRRWRRHWIARRVPEHVVLASGRSTGYTLRVRSLACIGVKTPYGDMIFCVESTRSGAFQPAELAPEAAKESFETRLRSILLATVVGHVDFMTWLRQKRAGRTTLMAALTSALGLVPELIRYFATGDGRPSLGALGTLVPSRLLGICLGLQMVMLLAMFFLGLLPGTEQISAGASEPVRKRLIPFTDYWTQAWYVGLAALTASAASVWLDGLPQWEQLRVGLSLVGTLLQVLASQRLLAAYFCINRFSRDPDAPAPTAVPPVVSAVCTTIALVAAPLVFFGHLGLPDLGDVGRGLSAVLTSVALCLLIGRLDSRSIGAPGLVSAFLYLSAIARAVCGLASPNIVAAVLLVRLPLDALLLAMIAWSIEGRALERYLTHAAEVAGMVPRKPVPVVSSPV